MKSIIVKNLTKNYGKGKEKVLAVDDVNFDVDHGEIFGLIGPDGCHEDHIALATERRNGASCFRRGLRYGERG